MAQSLTNIQSQLDVLAIANPYWSLTELRNWINDGVRDIARRSEALEAQLTIAAVAGTASYNFPASRLTRVHRVSFVPTGSTQTYTIQASTFEELDSIWGINHATQSSYPSYYALWGSAADPTLLTIQFYPVPAATGTFTILYYTIPTDLATDGSADASNLIIPSGWDDMVVQYVTYKALMKQKRQEYQEFKAQYDENMQYLIDVTRQFHDNGRFISPSGMSVPTWLYASSDG